MKHSFQKWIIALLFGVVVLGGCSSTREAGHSQSGKQQAELSNVQPGRFDGGRMWTFDYPPTDWFKEAYNFAPDQKWMDDVRMAALRFATYCSASFVSADGLVMTNHHCARQSVEDVSKEGEKLVDNGFWAPTLEEERKVPGLFVEQLVSIKDVTAEVQSAMDVAKTDEEKIANRRRKIEEIEKQASEETKLRAQIVTLYAGGKYSMYLYKRYDDVRLVFAPELKIGYFGGDPDNFTYPRYTLDCSFFRVYDEDGKPLRTDHYFKWSRSGASEGEPVFVIGNPGRTNRLNTTAQLEFNRDIQYPYISRILDDRVAVLKAYAELHPEKREEMINQVFNISNSQKAYAGQLAGLRNESLMQRRRAFDKNFHTAVNAKPELKAKYGHIWDEIAQSRAKVRSVAAELTGLRMNGLGVSDFMSRAAGLVKYATEMGMEEDKRSKAYQSSGLAAVKRALVKEFAADIDMERLTLEKQLELMRDWLGKDDPIIRIAFGGLSAKEAASNLLGKSSLKDVNVLQALVDGAPASIVNSDDPFIAIAKLGLPRYEKAQKVSEEVRTRDQVNQTLLGRALFDIYGTSIPPDATFSLRIADGVVMGFDYNGTTAPWYTTFYGMYDRHYSTKGKPEWDLPERWLNPSSSFDLSTPLNFVSTNDIIGGNSGSPMINKNKEIVGLIFDGNIESLPGDYIFAEDANNRTVSVHSSGMLEAMKHIYKAGRLATELSSGKMASKE